MQRTACSLALRSKANHSTTTVQCCSFHNNIFVRQGAQSERTKSRQPRALLTTRRLPGLGPVEGALPCAVVARSSSAAGYIHGCPTPKKINTICKATPRGEEETQRTTKERKDADKLTAGLVAVCGVLACPMER